jgi:hypothetical protein
VHGIDAEKNRNRHVFCAARYARGRRKRIDQIQPRARRRAHVAAGCRITTREYRAEFVGGEVGRRD